MKKRVLATILAVCLLFSVMACMANAADDFVIAEIISNERICPGDVIDDNFIKAPKVDGPVYAEGWEIKYEGSEWMPYDGEPIAENAGVFAIRYFAANADGSSYAYSNECIVTAKHNPKGGYEASGTDHWRVCDDCGAETEVYSRITGYYRPVQNWNDGKSQEYKDRKEYVIDHSSQKTENKVAVEEEKTVETFALLNDGVYLFATSTCPNCRMAKNFLAQANVEFKEIMATDNPELTKALNIHQAPTLVVVRNGECKLVENVSNIRRCIDDELAVKA